MLRGRYGFDQLSRALSFLGLGLMLVRMFITPTSAAWTVLNVASLMCIVLVLLRMFSKNFEARSKENAWFMRFWLKLTAFFKQGSGARAKVVRHNPTFEERRKYKYFSCTQCAQKLRVPRGKGKLMVTCTRCGNKFGIKS